MMNHAIKQRGLKMGLMEANMEQNTFGAAPV